MWRAVPLDEEERYMFTDYESDAGELVRLVKMIIPVRLRPITAECLAKMTLRVCKEPQSTSYNRLV